MSGSLKRDVVANYIGQGWRAAMSLVFVPLYIHYLGVESYGLVGVYTVLQAWLQLLDVGMRPTLSREMARFLGGAHTAQSIGNLLRTIEMATVAVAGAAAIGIILTSNWLATDWLQADDLPVDTVSQALMMMGLVVALRFVENLYLSSLNGLRKQVLLNVVMSIMATFRGGGVVLILAWYSATLEAFFAFQGIVSLITVVLYMYFVYNTLPRPKEPRRFSWDELQKVWRFAAGMMLITVLAVMLTQIDKMLLTSLLSLEAFGYYTLAAIVANGLYMLTNPVSLAYYPRLTELMTRGEEAELISTYHRGAQLVCVLMGSASVVLVLMADRVIWVWTGDIEITNNVSKLLSILALGNCLNCLMQMPYQLQLAAGWTSLVVKINIVAVLLLVPSVLLLVPVYGALGAAWVWVGLNSIYVMVQIALVHRRLLPDQMWTWYVSDVGMPLMAAYAMGLCVESLAPDNTGRLGSLIILGTASVLVPLAAALAAPQARELILRRLRLV